MKKTLLLSLVALIYAANSLAQVKHANKSSKADPCAGCDSVQNKACDPPETITLYYDTCAHKISLPGNDGLVSGKSYVIRICNVNDALYTLKVSASNITRVAALPPLLAQFNGYLSSTKVESSNLLSAKINFTDDYDSQLKAYFFIEQYKFDYNMLAIISNETKKLMDEAVQNRSQDELNKMAINTLTALRDSLNFRQKGIIEGAPALPHTENKDQNAANEKAKSNAEAMFNKFAAVDFENLPLFQAFVNSLLADFRSSMYVIYSPYAPDQSYLHSLGPSDIKAVKKTDDAIKKDSAFLVKCPAIIFSIKNNKCCIVTKPFQITADYLQMNLSLMRPKFSDKPDTVSVNKINFYRTNYWKWLDASVGFIYDNLASKSYYFKNTVPTEEIKSGSDVSIGALAHSYWVFKSWLKAGPAAGVAVSVLDGKSKYLLGGSIIFGKNNEWAFSGGIAFASLPQISNIYQNNTITTTSSSTVTTGGNSSSTTTGSSPSNSNTTTSGNTTTTTTTTQPIGTTGAVSTYNKIQRGYFFGLTYSLLKL